VRESLARLTGDDEEGASQTPEDMGDFLHLSCYFWD
jgi:hypothetical protein